MVNLKLTFNKKTYQGLHSFHKTTEKDDEITLDLSFFAESDYSNIDEETLLYDHSEILSQPTIPIEINMQTPSMQ